MAILQALAGGTIIYVVVFEVLERERSKNVSGLAQLFFVLLGFGVLVSVELLGKFFIFSNSSKFGHVIILVLYSRVRNSSTGTFINF